MAKIVLVGQEKGGAGKTTAARGLAEAVPGASIIEIDSSRRLLEYGDRVSFFPMRADRAAIERTGGRAARAEFDRVIDAIAAATNPTIVDIGANTSAALLSVLADLAPDFTAAGHRFALVIVVTAEPGALVEAPRLAEATATLAEAIFLLENQKHGPVTPGTIKSIAGDAIHTVFAEQNIEDAAVQLLQAGGLATIPNLDPSALTKQFGLALGGRIRRDLTRFRLEAMQSVRPAAEWLIG